MNTSKRSIHASESGYEPVYGIVYDETFDLPDLCDTDMDEEGWDIDLEDEEEGEDLLPEIYFPARGELDVH